MKKFHHSVALVAASFAGLAAAVASFASIVRAAVLLAASPIVWLYDAYMEISPLSAISGMGINLWRLVSGRVLSSQAGRGVSAFITNLFEVAGRSYLWQAARAA